MKTGNFIRNYYLEIIFVLLQTILYLLILFLGKATNIIAYSAICLCALFVLLKISNTPDKILLFLGSCLTVAADTLLVLTNGDKLIGMCLFLGVQTAYLARIIYVQRDRKIIYANVFVALVLVAVAVATTAAVLRTAADSLVFVSVTYFALLLTNVIFAFIVFKKSPSFAFGLLLFALCDLVIGLGYVCTYFNIGADSIIYKIAHPSFNLSWFFYLPSQVLIALSVNMKR